MSGIERNLANVSGSGILNRTWDMENISDGSMNAIFGETRMAISEFIACPDHQIMGQLRQQDQHLLCGKPMFVAARQSQSLFITFVLGFEAAAAQVVEMQGGHENLFRGWAREEGLSQEFAEHLIRERENQRMVTPTAILLALTQDQLAGWPGIGIRIFSPSDFPVSHFWIDIPGGYRSGQFDRTPPILDFDHDMVTTIEHPVDIFVLAATAVHAQDCAATPGFIQIQGFFSDQNKLCRLVSN